MTQTIVVKRFGGTVRAVTSKSYLHRAAICAALAEGESTLVHTDLCRDTEATVAALTALGAKIRTENGITRITPMPLSPHLPTGPLACGESASTFRFLIPLVAAMGGGGLQGEGRLLDRPLAPIADCLAPHGISLKREGSSLLVCGKPLASGEFHLAPDVSSQFTSGLLLTLPMLAGESRIVLEGAPVSRPYVTMTRAVQKAFGFDSTETENGYLVMGGQRGRAIEYTVEGDYSNAAFFLAAGAIGKDSVSVKGLEQHSLQGDRAILPILREFGAEYAFLDDTVTVTPATLRATDIDASDIPDLVPILSVVAACAEGKSRFFGVGRLRAKESNRLQGIIEMLTALGAHAESDGEILTVRGTKHFRGATVSSQNDHRLAMSAAIAAIRANGAVTIDASEAVSKSYPHFFEDFASLNVN